jgi:hypothetical protein
MHGRFVRRACVVRVWEADLLMSRVLFSKLSVIGFHFTHPDSVVLARMKSRPLWIGMLMRQSPIESRHVLR